MKAIERGDCRRRGGKKTYRSRFEWPSKTSILETPERIRCMRSTSFGDSGLGSPFFGSPPSKPVNVLTPTLKTPTNRKSPNVNSPEYAVSPLKSFMHVSAFSDAFGSPQNGSPPSKFRLSNPSQAVEYRFSGTCVPENDAPINMADDEVNGAVPSTSFKNYSFRSACRSLQNQLTRAARRRLLGEEENDDSAMDVTVPYGIPETPSKGFRNEMNIATSFDDYGFPLLTSTPMHLIVPSSRNQLIPPHYTIPEQANGPLESSLCEPVELFRVHGPPLLSPINTVDSGLSMSFSSATRVGMAISPTTRVVGRPTSAARVGMPILSATRPAIKTSGLERKVTQVMPRLIRKRVPEILSLPRICLQEATYTINRPFKPPSRPLKVNSKKWFQITCGETLHQTEMTRMAKFFLEGSQVISPH